MLKAGETVYPAVFAETFHSENAFLPVKRQWEAFLDQMLLNRDLTLEEEACRFTMCVSRQCETSQACV